MTLRRVWPTSASVVALMPSMVSFTVCQAGQKPDLGPCQREHGDGGRDHAQTADLDQDQDDRPAEQGPLGCRVKDDQAGDTGGGCRCEQGVQKGYMFTSCGGPGQTEQDSARQDHDEKAQQDHAEGREMILNIDLGL